MIEYRIQHKYNNEWEFITDSHGKTRIYLSLATAKKYGYGHMYTMWNTETRQFEMDPERYRIVVADIDWQPVED